LILLKASPAACTPVLNAEVMPSQMLFAILPVVVRIQLNPSEIPCLNVPKVEETEFQASMNGRVTAVLRFSHADVVTPTSHCHAEFIPSRIAPRAAPVKSLMLFQAPPIVVPMIAKVLVVRVTSHCHAAWRYPQTPSQIARTPSHAWPQFPVMTPRIVVMIPERTWERVWNAPPM